MLITRLTYTSKPLLVVIAVLLAAQVYYNVRFAQLCHYVDHGKTPPHPIAFEAFPFVVYNMYSGKIEDWNKYSYLMIEADGQPINVTDYTVIVEDQYLNPIGKFLQLKSHGFEEQYLVEYLQHLLKGRHIADEIYYKASNKNLTDKPDAFGLWLKRYLTIQMGKPVQQVKLYNCIYGYNADGKVEQVSKELAYQIAE